VAKDAGIFERSGVDVELRQVEGTASTAVQAGEVHVALIGGSEAVNFAAGGGDVAVIAVMEPVYPYKLEVAPRIRTVADLKGQAAHREAARALAGQGPPPRSPTTRGSLEPTGLRPI
jgi:hypothetical protein